MTQAPKITATVRPLPAQKDKPVNASRDAASDASHQTLLGRLHRVLDRRLFFIVGLTRTGTHWLQQALDAHPDAICRGEGHMGDILRPLLEKALKSYDAHAIRSKSLIEAAGGRSHALGFDPEDLRALTLFAGALALEHMIGDKDPVAIGERTPEYTMMLPTMAEIAPDARFIHVIRDGRDETAAAWEFNLRMKRKGFLEKYPDLDAYAEAFSAQWSMAVGKARYFARQNPDRVLQVFAEDFNGKPRRTLRKICLFLGLDDTDAVLQNCLDAGHGWALVDSGAGAWKRVFSETARAHFKRNAGELLKLLEYEI
ncbi:MAG: sulfotransferase family protein [Rhodospirillales bacterium]